MATATVAVSTEFATGFAARWTNPSNAFATVGDNIYATGIPAKSSNVGSGFGYAFSSGLIPDGSIITAMSATIEWKLSALVTGGLLTIDTYGLAGVFAGGSVTKTTTVEEQSTVSYSTLSTVASLRTAATSSAGDNYLNVSVDKGSTNSALTASIDFISVTVTFTPPATGKAPPFERSRNRRRNTLIRL